MGQKLLLLALLPALNGVAKAQGNPPPPPPPPTPAGTVIVSLSSPSPGAVYTNGNFVTLSGSVNATVQGVDGTGSYSASFASNGIVWAEASNNFLVTLNPTGTATESVGFSANLPPGSYSAVIVGYLNAPGRQTAYGAKGTGFSVTP